MTDDPTDPPDPDPTDPPDPNPDDADPPAGATDRERALAREAAGYRRKLRDTEKERDDYKAQAQSEADKAIDEARKDERQKVMAEVRMKLVTGEVRARAAGKLTDPDDAARYLDLEELADLDDKQRGPAIDKGIDELVESRSYLATDSGGGGNGDARPSPGARGTPRPGSRGKEPDPDAWIRERARR